MLLHQITNDVREYSPNECVTYLDDMLRTFTKEHPTTKVVISLGLPRKDNIELATQVEIVNALIKQSVLSANFDNVRYCDHSNFVYNGVPKDHLIDGFHLTSEGTSLLCSNVRFKIELALGFNSRRRGGRSV